MEKSFFYIITLNFGSTQITENGIWTINSKEEALPQKLFQDIYANVTVEAKKQFNIVQENPTTIFYSLIPNMPL